MRLIAEAAVPSLRARVYLQGEVSASKTAVLPPPRHGYRFHVYVSPHNLGSAALIEEVREAIGLPALSTTHTLDDLPSCECMLCYLNGDTWTGGPRSDAFTVEVARAMSLGVGLLLAHEMPGLGQASRCGVEFVSFFTCKDGATDPALLKAGIYGSIAVPLKGGAWRQASMAMLARSLVEVEPKAATPVGPLQVQTRPSRITSTPATEGSMATCSSHRWTGRGSTKDCSVGRSDTRRSHLSMRGSSMLALQREAPPTARGGGSVRKGLEVLKQAASRVSSRSSMASQRQQCLAEPSTLVDAEVPPHGSTLPGGEASSARDGPCDIFGEHLASRPSVAAFCGSFRDELDSHTLATSSVSDENQHDRQWPENTHAVAAQPYLANGAHSLSAAGGVEDAVSFIPSAPLPPPGHEVVAENHDSVMQLTAVQHILNTRRQLSNMQSREGQDHQQLTQRQCGTQGSTGNRCTAEAREKSRQALQRRLEEHNRRVTHLNNEALSSARINAAACLSHRSHTPSSPLKLPVGRAAGCNDSALPPTCSATSGGRQTTPDLEVELESTAQVPQISVLGPIGQPQRSSGSTSSGRSSMRPELEERLPAAPSPASVAECKASGLNASTSAPTEPAQLVQFI